MEKVIRKYKSRFRYKRKMLEVIDSFLNKTFTGSLVLFDSQCYSEDNEDLTDYFEENLYRILYVNSKSIRIISIRSCRNDEDDWTTLKVIEGEQNWYLIKQQLTFDCFVGVTEDGLSMETDDLIHLKWELHKDNILELRFPQNINENKIREVFGLKGGTHD